MAELAEAEQLTQVEPSEEVVAVVHTVAAVAVALVAHTAVVEVEAGTFAEEMVELAVAEEPSEGDQKVEAEPEVAVQPQELRMERHQTSLRGLRTEEEARSADQPRVPKAG